GTPESRLGYPVTGKCRHRLETTPQFMLALSPGIELLQPVTNTVVDPLVVTGLEMQIVVVRVGTPVTTEQRIPTFEEQGGGDVLAPLLRKNHKQISSQTGTDKRKELVVEIGLLPAYMIRILI